MGRMIWENGVLNGLRMGKSFLGNQKFMAEEVVIFHNPSGDQIKVFAGFTVWI